jgi:acetyl-CoA carboxylase carboxyl transferase subunit beta
MPISDWFSARENKRYIKVSDAPAGSGSADVPDGVWVNCESCKQIIYEGELAENLRVCPECGFHFNLTAQQRIELLADKGSFVELDADLAPCDPLQWQAIKTYADQLTAAAEKSGLSEAIVTGATLLSGHPVVLGAMDFRFIGASMGSVVGEKIARAFEFATAGRLPIVLVTASGGARMQEGMLSLMQMAKTSATVRRHSEAGLPFISVLANPTYGGVTASFAVLGDVLLAEPGALIGFTGGRVIEQNLHLKLPKGFQTAEFMLEHGMIDEVVPRGELKDRVGLLLDYLTPVVRGGVATA